MKTEDKAKTPEIVKKAGSEKFTNAVLSEFSANVGEVNLSQFQKKLIQNYFIKLDRTLKDAELKRQSKGNYADAVPVTWENINLPKLAQDVVSLSLVGLDPLMNNHVNLIPYKNNSTGKYDITPIVGYRGLELTAKKYALETPDDVVIELVYSNDKFKQIKKSASNKVENYEFEIQDSFDRGELVGGFYYIMFFETPEKNRLRVFNLEQIEKRRPAYASPEFWGGEKDEYKSGKKTGEKIKVEGWFEEMAFKTICRAAYNSFTIDSEKINEHFIHVMELDQQQPAPASKQIESKVKEEINFESVTETVQFEEVKKEEEVKNSPETKEPKF